MMDALKKAWLAVKYIDQTRAGPFLCGRWGVTLRTPGQRDFDLGLYAQFKKAAERNKLDILAFDKAAAPEGFDPKSLRVMRRYLLYTGEMAQAAVYSFDPYKKALALSQLRKWAAAKPQDDAKLFGRKMSRAELLAEVEQGTAHGKAFLKHFEGMSRRTQTPLETLIRKTIVP